MVQYFGDVPAEISSSAMAIISGYMRTCTQTKFYNLGLKKSMGWNRKNSIKLKKVGFADLNQGFKNRFSYVS